MTDNKLKRLGRAELLEMLLTQVKENEQLKEQLADANKQLESKAIKIGNVGTLAEASLKLNGVFDAAQAAADQYLENIRNTEDVCNLLRQDAEKEAAQIIANAKEEAAKIKADSEQYWNEVSEKLEHFYQEHQGLRELLNISVNK